MYMSYCRYEGTRDELRVCLKDAEEHINGEAEYKVSETEIHHFENMIREFTDWLHDMALLDEDGYLNDDALNEVLESMKTANEENDAE